MDNWSAWTACPVTCGEGQVTRDRQVTTYPKYGGTECPKLTAITECENLPSCPGKVPHCTGLCMYIYVFTDSVVQFSNDTVLREYRFSCTI